MICHTASHPPYLHPSLVGNIFGNFWKIWSTFYFMIWSYCIPPTLPAPIPCWQHFWQLLENLGYFLFHDLVTLHPTHPTYTHPLLASNAVQIIREACFCHSKVEKFLSLNFFSTFEDATTMMR